MMGYIILLVIINYGLITRNKFVPWNLVLLLSYPLLLWSDSIRMEIFQSDRNIANLLYTKDYGRKVHQAFINIIVKKQK